MLVSHPGIRFVLCVLSMVLSLATTAAAQDPEPGTSNTDNQVAADENTNANQATPRPPENLTARDRPWDKGHVIQLSFDFSPDDLPPEEKASVSDSGELIPAKPDPDDLVTEYVVMRSMEANGLYQEVARVTEEPSEEQNDDKADVTIEIEKNDKGVPYFFRVYAVNNRETDEKTKDSVKSEFVATSSETGVIATEQAFDGSRFRLALIGAIVCFSVLLFIVLARYGMPLKVRKIAGLEAIDEAVGRATEMGRSCLFIPGIQDMNDIQTVAGITILSRVATTAAEFDAKVEVPTSRSLVMTACRETIQGSFLTAGRPDAYNEDLIYYVTDEQFGFVAYVSGMMVREEPAACFYFGSFFAESLILAETGNSIGAIQVAGTAQPAQLPFFVAACDYTLIGEELFAASAYLSGSPEELGSLKGQDVGKVIAAVGIVLGFILALVSPVLTKLIFDDDFIYHL